MNLPVRRGVRRRSNFLHLTEGAIRTAGGSVLDPRARNLHVTALDNISFSIAKGERVGLVGHNGAGKSTLLRLMAGIYYPAAGVCEVQGRVSTLFTNFLGVNRDATGLENVILSGLALGLSRKEIDALIPDIVQFSELGDFLNLPVRTYSSGMSARLGFAVATAIQPDILLIDEVFGAGDSHFRDKAKERITKLLKSAPTLVFASHSGQILSEFCDRLIWLERGKIKAEGSVAEIRELYWPGQGEKAALAAKRKEARPAAQPRKPTLQLSAVHIGAIKKQGLRRYQSITKYFPGYLFEWEDADPAAGAADPGHDDPGVPSLDFSLAGFPPCTVSVPFDWRLDSEADPSWLLMLHSLNWLRPHLAPESGVSMQTAALSIARDWLLHHVKWPTSLPDPPAFTTAALIERLATLIEGVRCCEALGRKGSPMMFDMLSGVLSHVTFLSARSRTRPDVRSDLAILRTCAGFPGLLVRDTLVEQASSRLVAECGAVSIESGLDGPDEVHLRAALLHRIAEAIPLTEELEIAPDRVTRLKEFVSRFQGQALPAAPAPAATAFPSRPPAAALDSHVKRSPAPPAAKAKPIHADHVRDRCSQAYLGLLGWRGFETLLRRRLDWIADQVIGPRVLDLGCSEGMMEILLARRGLTVTGVDVNAEALGYAGELLAKEPPEVRERCTFVDGDIFNVNLPDPPYDTVVLGEIIEHLTEPGKLIEIGLSKLRPGGRIVITTPFGYLPHDDHHFVFFFRNFLALVEGRCAIEHISVEDGYIRFVGRNDPAAAAPRLESDRLLELSERALLDSQQELYRRLTRQQRNLETNRRSLEMHKAALSESKRKLESLSTSVRYRVGDLVAGALQDPLQLVLLPVRILQLVLTHRSGNGDARTAGRPGRVADSASSPDRAVRAADTGAPPPGGIGARPSSSPDSANSPDSRG